MSDLAAFLLARIDEDEVVARKCDEWDQRFRDSGVGVKHVWARLTDEGGHSFWEGCPTPSRVLAECAAKRAIIELHQPHSFGGGPDGCSVCTQWDDYPHRVESGIDPWPCPTLLALAQPFADHPAFDPAWRTS